MQEHHFFTIVSSFEVSLTHHAKCRKKQRNISEQEIHATLFFGKPYRQGNGRTAFYLGRKEHQIAKEKGYEFSFSSGIAVVESEDCQIITVIRCDSPRKLRRFSFSFNGSSSPPETTKKQRGQR